MKIVQIAYSTVPAIIAECMQTVSSWANANGHEYQVITEISEEYKSLPDIRVTSNYHRIDLMCQNADSAYFDWDVKLLEGFALISGSAPKFNSLGDNIIYSGDIVFWQEVRRWMEAPEEHPYEIGRVFHALSSGVVKVEKEMILPGETFTHLNYTGNKL
jgi:hypothetical protein